ncbi:endonuclease/exonuclease/phosphatase family protein [Oceanirhabdus sp. W0125-5]|uniref:endonuclease/exonuclease/phosphatase family protein n=1 Tax=Oceanirhabdus sp. W0125-5 TaxID=2999116 RepID=UPI0022F2D707|nr:endonuclease/exonuclease/phosphatase family protein [Oceanirhabdus sp. W0125-5]WBW97029.1 endonuclease/exonuclease/phosphatase family protein [Oceanirhabdus sp. W0125-5]
MKKIKYLLMVVVTIAILVAGYFVFMTVTDYKPEPKITLEINQKSNEDIESYEFAATIFNIGYCGLDKEQDFFMDGGTGSRASSKETVLSNLESITSFLEENEDDFILLQEVDFKSKRTYHINQHERLSNSFKDYSDTYAINYKVPWVPVPITKPMGNVKSGLVTLSKYKIDSSIRYQFPGEEKWPRQLALLDRCFIETRHKLNDDKDLVIINTHMSAYDKGGFIRHQQMNFLVKYLNEEYEKGNYVVVGGDWNHEMPGSDSDMLNPGKERLEWVKEIDVDFPNYKWAVDEKTPTNRYDDKPYVKGENYITVLDGFLVSDNIEVIEVKTSDLGFENSDHNPVTLKFSLKND